MKSMTFSMILLFSFTVWGEVRFATGTKLPSHVQKEITKAYAEKCPSGAEMNWLIQELVTHLTVDQVDNGLTDFYFTSNFEVYAKEYDSNHSRVLPMTIETVLTEANNGSFIQVKISGGCQ